MKLRSGGKLTVTDNFLSADINGNTVRVLKFSNGFAEKLETLKNKGYEPISAQVGYIVAWQGEEDKNESAIILPILKLKQVHTENLRDGKMQV